MVGETRTLYTPACLTCGWHGEGGTRLEAEDEGRVHEHGRSPDLDEFREVAPRPRVDYMP